MTTSSKYTREELISRYEKIIDEWNNDEELKRILPDAYNDIVNKLEGLKNGGSYIVKDVTKECILVGGALLCGGQLGYGKYPSPPYHLSERYRKSLEEFIKEYSK